VLFGPKRLVTRGMAAKYLYFCFVLCQEVKKENSIGTYPDKTKEGYRYWKYQDSIIPCVGTHVDNTKEIGKINYDYSFKKGHQTIKIILEN
jgi:Ser-tRNA(Ala) deacylase AlaX